MFVGDMLRTNSSLNSVNKAGQLYARAKEFKVLKFTSQVPRLISSQARDFNNVNKASHLYIRITGSKTMKFTCQDPSLELKSKAKSNWRQVIQVTKKRNGSQPSSL